MTPTQVLFRAAQLLESNAEDLKRSHSIGDRWYMRDSIDMSAREHYDEEMAIAAKLRVLAGTGD